MARSGRPIPFRGQALVSTAVIGRSLCCGRTGRRLESDPDGSDRAVEQLPGRSSAGIGDEGIHTKSLTRGALVLEMLPRQRDRREIL